MLLRKYILLLLVFPLLATTFTWAQQWNPSHTVGPVSGKYAYQNGQIPDQLVEIYPAAIPAIGLSYEWQISYTVNEDNFVPIAGASQSSYMPGQLIRTTYYRRKSTHSSGASIYSNIIKLSVVSANWVDRNYVREFDIQVTGVTTVQAIAQLPVGQMLESTTYLDGLGRSVQNISREIATPQQPGGVWGDIVKFNKYDEFGRQVQKHLQYTTTAEIGKYKANPELVQGQYYASNYNETAPFIQIDYDPNPLHRPGNIKEAGSITTGNGGNSFEVGVNTAAENVQQFYPGYFYYRTNDMPQKRGVYAANTLLKYTSIDKTDGRNLMVVEYYDNGGHLILKKIQLSDVPTVAHDGWVCTYYIYDPWGNLIYQLQPEAVKYLDTHNWSFETQEGVQVFNELCYYYKYDWFHRQVEKKLPGAALMRMLYDGRNRLVLTQDGNQAALSTPQWTATLYDELDRPVMATLYNTNKTVEQLQADIDNAAAVTNGTTAFKSPINAADLGNPIITTVLKKLFYDNYSFTSVKQFNTSFTNSQAYATTDPNVLPIVATKRTLGFETGSLTRVLGTNTFLAATHYYDEDGQGCQLLDENIKGGTDITTMQYHFDGRLLSTCLDHTAPGTGYTNFITVTKYGFDKLGRVTAVEKQFGTNVFKTVATYDYDDFGRVKTKHLDPNYTAGNNGLESLNYSFNIHNQLIGINKDYALKNPAGYDKWSHFFGIYLGYENRDHTFTKGLLNGQLSGVLWNTQGDDAQRKYEFTYDNIGRLNSAIFMEQKQPGQGWSNNKMDFSVIGTSGKITHDLNGNLLNMLHKGVVPGQAAPMTIDELNYSYVNRSNKLQSVTDIMTNTNLNGKLGDFKDGNNGQAPDYVYDNNGNLVIDLNKDIRDPVAGSSNGIVYNHLDKPELIRVAGKGTIKIIYSADGDKVKRTFTPETGDATSITYINQFVYEATGNNDDVLSYINFEEGRIRVITPTAETNGNDVLAISGNMTLPNGKEGVYDYFIKDYLGNVRMVLTEEIHLAANTCTMEMDRDLTETAIFGQAGAANEVSASRYPAPAAWNYPDKGNSVSRLGNLAGHNIGPNSLQKVMAGDKVTAQVQYFYHNATGGSNPDFLTTLLTSLGQAIVGSPIAGNAVKSSVTGITNGLNGTAGFIDAVQPSGPGNTTPKAYLTMLFFDERFNFIEAVDGGVWQEQVAASVGSGGLPLGFASIKAPKNGFVYVYVSNQSEQDVYFDNFKVGITRGNIIEENHYYAYGLRIAAISSRKPGDVKEGKVANNYLYNDKELFEEGDVNWYDYGFRNYDPQIGRFIQIDPLTDDLPVLSPYLYANCDPVNEIDIEGLIGGTPGTAQVLETVYVVYRKSANVAAATTNRFIVSATTLAIKGATTTTGAVNGSAATKPAGKGFWASAVGGFKGYFTRIGEAVTNPEKVLKGAFSMEALKENVLNTATMGAYGQVMEGIENAEKISEKGWDGVGEIVGDKAADVLVTYTTEGLGKGFGALGKVVKETRVASKTMKVVEKVKNILKPCGCFVAGTLILTDTGYAQIQDIKVGDKVLAYNDTIGVFDIKRVKQVFSYIRDSVYEIAVGGNVIKATSDHPFFVYGKWVDVKNLKLGDSLNTYTGQKLAISSIRIVPGETKVYNFEVEDYHTYYVSDQKVLVHNAGPCPNGKIKNGPEFGDLKDHAKRHSVDGDAVKYYNSAVMNVKNAKWKFKVRHDGKNKMVYVSSLGNGKFMFTSVSMNGKRIFTHLEVDAQYLSNKGITLPK